MPKKKEPEDWEFEKFALQRNDDAIRFSETKAALLLTLTGLLLGVVADKVQSFKDLFFTSSSGVQILIVCSLALILAGILLVAVSSLLAVFPRLKVVKNISLLYFDHLARLSEQEAMERFEDLNAKEKHEHLLSQIYATSRIAARKFKLIRSALWGTVLVVIGSLLAIFAMFFG
ncbi:MAG: hypothetical protein HFACDABA_03042 [Anaerolineales bacterium]|nr:hypothetical protein [Anaerolineales bacterium]